MVTLAWQIPHWRKTDHEYPAHVPYLANYLHDRRWIDEPPTTTTAPRTWRQAQPVKLPIASGNYAREAAADPDPATAKGNGAIADDVGAKKVEGLIEQIAATKGAT
jgi:hypothetical protein